MKPTFVDFSGFPHVAAPSREAQIQSAVKFVRNFFGLDNLIPSQMVSGLTDFVKAQSDDECCSACVASGDFAGTCPLHFKPLQIFRENSHGHEIFVVRLSKCSNSEALIFLKRKKVSKLIAVSGLSDVQLQMSFDNFHFEEVSREVKAAALAARNVADDGQWLVLGGMRGSGKTHLAIAIILKTLQSERSGRFWLVSELMAKLRAGHSDGSHNEILDSVKSVSCLVLDDFGGKQKVTEATFDYIFQIVDYRYRFNLQTILTTNFATAKELIDSVDIDIIPVISRIYERGKWISIGNGKDFRVHHRAA